MAARNAEQKLLGKIRGKGRGWAFSPRDFTRLASRGAIDVALHRLLTGGKIRRVIRGIYDYPTFSDLLGFDVSPDVDQVAAALARKFGWRIQPSGPAAQNLLGLSTQVDAAGGDRCRLRAWQAPPADPGLRSAPAVAAAIGHRVDRGVSPLGCRRVRETNRERVSVLRVSSD